MSTSESPTTAASLTDWQLKFPQGVLPTVVVVLSGILIFAIISEIATRPFFLRQNLPTPNWEWRLLACSAVWIVAWLAWPLRRVQNAWVFMDGHVYQPGEVFFVWWGPLRSPKVAFVYKEFTVRKQINLEFLKGSQTLMLEATLNVSFDSSFLDLPMRKFDPASFNDQLGDQIAMVLIDRAKKYSMPRILDGWFEFAPWHESTSAGTFAWDGKVRLYQPPIKHYLR